MDDSPAVHAVESAAGSGQSSTGGGAGLVDDSVVAGVVSVVGGAAVVGTAVGAAVVSGASVAAGGSESEHAAISTPAAVNAIHRRAPALIPLILSFPKGPFGSPRKDRSGGWVGQRSPSFT